jgi:hypothetical protein
VEENDADAVREPSETTAGKEMYARTDRLAGCRVK